MISPAHALTPALHMTWLYLQCTQSYVSLTGSCSHTISYEINFWNYLTFFFSGSSGITHFILPYIILHASGIGIPANFAVWVMVSELTLSGVDCGFKPQSGHTKDYKIDICCFSARQTPSRKKSKYLLARNQDHVSEWGNTSICGLMF